MTTQKYLRELGARDARAGKSINAFYDAPLAGHHRHNETARAEYEIGYRAEKQEMRAEIYRNAKGEYYGAPEKPRPDWLLSAPEYGTARVEYYLRLISNLAAQVTPEQLLDAITKALERKP